MSSLGSHDLARALLQVLAILGVSRVLARLARRLGQPTVIAEMLAGIVLGPSLLGWLAPSVSVWLFPVSSLSGLRLLSQLGLVLFMFLVGLELDTSLLRGRGRVSLSVGAASLLVPLFVGLCSAPWLHARYGGEAPLLPFALFLSAAASVTAFPVLARILSERHLLTTQVGAIAIGAAAVDDLGAWSLVTVLLAASRSDGWLEGLWVALAGVALVGMMLLVLRPWLVRAVRRIERSRDLGTGTVSAMLFPLLLVAASSELLGVHALFGAFLFGAVLPKDGPLAELLADKLETVTTGLLLPLFFAQSGLRTELTLLDSRADWLVTLGIIVVASTAKLGGSALVARANGQSWRESTAIGVLLNTRGLMGLIVLNVGLDLRVVSPTVFTMLVVTALATTLATSPLLRWTYPDREVIAERFVELTPKDALPSTPRPEAIVACISDPRTGPGLAAIAHAFVGDRAPPAERARVFGLHLAEPTDRASSELRRPASPPALTDFLAKAEALGVEARSLSFVSSRPAEDIVRIAEAKHASTVLLGDHASWPLARPAGGVVAEVIDRARMTVCVLTGAEQAAAGEEHKALLVATTGGPRDVAVMAVAERLGARTGVRVSWLDLASRATNAPQAWRRVGNAGGSPRDALRKAAREEHYDLVIVALAPPWEVGTERAPFFERLGAPVLLVRGAIDEGRADGELTRTAERKAVG